MATTQSGAEGRDDRSLMSKMTSEIRKPSAPVELDDMDRRLLVLLSEDPRLSQRQLARAVGMSAPAVGERVNRLERQGVIRGYTTVLDWSKLGFSGLVHLPMTLTPDADLGALLADLRSLPELVDLVVVTGSYDLIARFRIRDHGHLQTLLLDRIWPIKGLQRIETFLTLGEVLTEHSLADLLGVEPSAIEAEEG
ncbi:Lrp/AsnC family transcriptional regulator [Demequina sp. NBRC 110054]|uniref:Lrp/AsnC family transcriptional regulator n=1 Tax=Demequina sp. NBRC 110054 TaxID=1570343 RepID=UPI0013565926|nr:Lrp/AsnC family transcriptional regulator [Demequina sp. NBRC 110054]